MLKAIMYGAGSIGRGFMGQLFSESGYEVIFIDVNQNLISLLNKRGEYPIKFVKDGFSKELTVKNVCGICANDTSSVLKAIADADIIATSVGKNFLPTIAKNVAYGLKIRWKNKCYDPINIIVCENMIKANEYLGSCIERYFDDKEKQLFLKLVGMVETCINRNVPVMTKELQDGDPLKIVAENYDELPVDKNSFKGPIPNIKHMIPYSPFDFFIRRKLFMYNMSHAVTAYLGSLLKTTKLSEAIKIPEIKYIVLCALKESSIALSHEYAANLEELLNFSSELIYRFGNKLLGTTIERVAMDPKRKLSKDDRLLGAAEVCLKHGIFPSYIAIGIAAGYCYTNPNDPTTVEVQQYIESNGIKKALAIYSRIHNNSFSKYVEKIYVLLKEGTPLKEIIDQAEARIYFDNDAFNERNQYYAN